MLLLPSEPMPLGLPDPGAAGASHTAVQCHNDQQGGQAAAGVPAEPSEGGGGQQVQVRLCSWLLVLEAACQSMPAAAAALAAAISTVAAAELFEVAADKLAMYPSSSALAPHCSTVDTLRQQYMFVPAKYKDCYLAFLLTELTGALQD